MGFLPGSPVARLPVRMTRTVRTPNTFRRFRELDRGSVPQDMLGGGNPHSAGQPFALIPLQLPMLSDDIWMAMISKLPLLVRATSACDWDSVPRYNMRNRFLGRPLVSNGNYVRSSTARTTHVAPNSFVAFVIKEIQAVVHMRAAPGEGVPSVSAWGSEINWEYLKTMRATIIPNGRGLQIRQKNTRGNGPGGMAFKTKSLFPEIQAQAMAPSACDDASLVSALSDRPSTEQVRAAVMPVMDTPG